MTVISVLISTGYYSCQSDEYFVFTPKLNIQIKTVSVPNRVTGHRSTLIDF